MHRAAEQVAWSDMIGRDHKINNMGLDHLQHLQAKKEMPTRQHYGEIIKNIFQGLKMFGCPS